LFSLCFHKKTAEAAGDSVLRIRFLARSVRLDDPLAIVVI
jgi:hypothetical protein